MIQFVDRSSYDVRRAAASVRRSTASEEDNSHRLSIGGHLPCRMERIQHSRAEPSDIRIVARDQRHLMNLGGCCQETIHDRNWTYRVQSPPFVCNFTVDRKNAITECIVNLPKPRFQGSGLDRVARS